jgi:hypothetical protein
MRTTRSRSAEDARSLESLEPASGRSPGPTAKKLRAAALAGGSRAVPSYAREARPWARTSAAGPRCYGEELAAPVGESGQWPLPRRSSLPAGKNAVNAATLAGG